MATRIRNDWAVGQIVNIGFVKGLVVKDKIATPGDHKPDMYVLWYPAANRWYSFVPHNGLSRHDNGEQARNSW